MTTSHALPYTMNHKNHPGPSHINRDPTLGWMFLIIGIVFLFSFSAIISFSDVLQNTAKDKHIMESIAAAAASLFLPFFLMTLGGLSLSIRTKWAARKLEEAQKALSIDVARHCHQKENISQDVIVAIHPPKFPRNAIMIDVLSIMNSDMFGFQKLNAQNTPLFKSWLKSHWLPTRIFLTFWICASPFQIKVNPLSAHQKIRLFSNKN